MAPHSSILPGESHGQRSLVGCRPWGCKESDTTERLHFHFSLSCIGEGNGNPLQCSCLENPRDGEAWWAAVYGVRVGDRVGQDWSDLAAAVRYLLIITGLTIMPEVWNSEKPLASWHPFSPVLLGKPNSPHLFLILSLQVNACFWFCGISEIDFNCILQLTYEATKTRDQWNEKKKKSLKSIKLNSAYLG